MAIEYNILRGKMAYHLNWPEVGSLRDANGGWPIK